MASYLPLSLKRLHYILIFSLVSTLPVSAQERADSLLQVLQKTQFDSIKAKVYMQLAGVYEYANPAQSKQYAEQALELGKKNRLEKVVWQAHKRLAFYYYVIGNYAEALDEDNKSLQASAGMKDSVGVAEAELNIGNDYYDLGDYDEAYSYFTESFRVSKIKSDSMLMNMALHNVGRVFKEIGQYDKALDYLKASQKMSVKLNDQEGLPYSLDEIGDVMLRKKAYDSALAVLMKALEETRALKIGVLEPKVLSKIADIYSQKGDYSKALSYYDSTQSIHEANHNNYGIAEVEVGRGLIAFKEGHVDEALELIQDALSKAENLNAVTLQIRCYNELSTIWEGKGNYKEALQAFRQYQALEDSMFSREMQGKLQRDQIRFETSIKDDQIAALTEREELQQNEISKQEFIKNILVVTFALTAILLLSVYRSGQRRKHINALLLQHQQETEKRREELERLNEVKDKFFSIISHDLRSPINALAGVLDLMDKNAITGPEFEKNLKELRRRFNHTRTLLNNLLDWTLLQMDKLNLQNSSIDIHAIVNENIQLLSSVQTKDLQIVNDVPLDCIVLGDTNTVNLVIRNLMSNAIKFTNEKGEIHIGAVQQGDKWNIFVKDNGIGINPEVLNKLFDKTSPYSTRGTANEKGTGLGLILSKEFVEKNGGKIWVESEVGKGSAFWFSLHRSLEAADVPH